MTCFTARPETLFTTIFPLSPFLIFPQNRDFLFPLLGNFGSRSDRLATCSRSISFNQRGRDQQDGAAKTDDQQCNQPKALLGIWDQVRPDQTRPKPPLSNDQEIRSRPDQTAQLFSFLIIRSLHTFLDDLQGPQLELHLPYDTYPNLYTFHVCIYLWKILFM